MSSQPIAFNFGFPESVTFDIFHLALVVLLLLAVVIGVLSRRKIIARQNTANSQKVSRRVEELSKVIAEEREQVQREQVKAPSVVEVLPTQTPQQPDTQASLKTAVQTVKPPSTSQPLTQITDQPSDTSQPSNSSDPDPVNPDVCALQLLALFQQEARLVDFLQESLEGFSDEDVAAAARVVHEGGQKVLRQYFTLVSVRDETEESRITLQPGFDTAQVRLTGNVVGVAPFTGTLTHRGWKATAVTLPQRSQSYCAEVIMPAEVEL